jgi:Cu(I)/Ag(I) efflux system protein CusF
MSRRHYAVLPIAVLAVLLAGPVQAQQPAVDHAAHHADSSSTEKALPLIDGEVRRIDKSAVKLTIKHGPIPNLDMPAMTMVFKVREPDMLNKVGVGDKVKFSVEKVDGAMVVTEIQALK